MGEVKAGIRIKLSTEGEAAVSAAAAKVRGLEKEMGRLAKAEAQRRVTAQARERMYAREAAQSPLAAEMDRQRRMMERRALSREARAALGAGSGAPGGFLQGHGFTTRARAMVGAARDMTIAATGVGMAFGVMAGGIGSVLDPLRQFQHSIAQTKAKGFDPSKLGELEEFTRNLGRTTQFSATQAAAGSVALAAAGLTDMPGMKQALPTALRFSLASGMDTARSADTLVDTAGQFGMHASDFERIGDAMQRAADMSTIGVEDLAESLKYAGAIAKQVGFQLEDTTATIALLGERGIKGSEAGTALRGIFTRMARPTKMAYKALGGLGLDKEDLHGYINRRDIPGYFRELDKRMKERGYTDAQRLESAKAIFGQEQLTAALNLMVAANEKTAEGVYVWDQWIAKNRDAQGALQRTAEIMGDTVEGKIQKFNASWEEAKISLATQFLPELNRLLPKLAQGAVATGQWVSQNGALIKTTAGIGTAAAAAAIGWKGLTLAGGMLAALPGTAAVTAAGTTFGTTFAAAAVAAIAGYGIATAILEATKGPSGTNIMEDFGRWAFDVQNGTAVSRQEGRGMSNTPGGSSMAGLLEESVTVPAATPETGVEQFNAVTGQIEVKVTDQRVQVVTRSRGPVKLRTGENAGARETPFGSAL